MLKDKLKKARLALKSHFMGKQWDAAMVGDYEKAEEWKSLAEWSRDRKVDYDDIRDDLYESVIRNLKYFPHDAQDQASALQKAIEHLAKPCDIYGEEVTVEKLQGYLERISDDKKAEIVPTFTEEQIAKAQAFDKGQAEAQEAKSEMMAAWDAIDPNLFENPKKLAIMRSVDFEVGKDGTWAEFADVVNEKIRAEAPDLS